MWRSCPGDSLRLLRPPDLSLQGRTQQRQLAVPLIRRKRGLMRINALATQRCFCSDVQRGSTCRSASQSRPGIDLRRALVGLLQPPTPGCPLPLVLAGMLHRPGSFSVAVWTKARIFF